MAWQRNDGGCCHGGSGDRRDDVAAGTDEVADDVEMTTVTAANIVGQMSS